MFEYIVNIVSVLAGTLVSSFVAKAFITKSLKDLETALTMCHRINTSLAEIHVKISVIDEMKELLHEHDRKIVALGTKGYGQRRSNHTNGNG